MNIRRSEALHKLLSVTTVWFPHVGPDDVLMMQNGHRLRLSGK